MISIKFSMFIDRKHVAKRISAKQRRVLGKAGGFGRVVMKREIRPPKSGKKSRTVVVNGLAVIVPARGKVVDAKTQRPVSKKIADLARLAMAKRYKSESAGKPPRRGPSDLLRQHIYFGVEPDGESVVIGPMAFRKQPHLVGAKTVPELLNKGGSQNIMGQYVKYDPHPFTSRPAELAAKKLAELVKSEPL